LCFFNNILIYSSSWAEHLQHVNIILDMLRAHHLHLKPSKCSFKAFSVAYPGHVIFMDGFAMDSDKVPAVDSWLVSCSTRGLHSFLGLVGYYRKFIRDLHHRNPIGAVGVQGCLLLDERGRPCVLGAQTRPIDGTSAPDAGL
jgi:hypothetical protein